MGKTTSHSLPSTETARAAKAPLSRGDEARQRIIGVAEALFGRQGFDGTSMRQIASDANMQAASLYYHFPSKDDLILAVWESGGLELLERIKAAADHCGTPWERLDALSIAHVAGLLDWRKANQMLFMMPPWQYPEAMRDRVVALRDDYEGVFAEAINELPLRADVDRGLFRLTLIGALSWTLYWYRPDGGTPEHIARAILSTLRTGVEVCVE